MKFLENIETEKVFFLCAAFVLSIGILSIIYYNLEQNKNFSKGYEECYVKIGNHTKTIMVKDCSKVLKEYIELNKQVEQ